ncbi:GNAT family N-acetyltransferase [Halobacillus sp. BAB-2008]|uniref:GNAT family N-acetyltransferase n=1 Tax=Halobacillus sp. BAB-2008 TaxID=1246484 RepID=UPI0002A500DF|nr:GNAT family N-acetyltransferase [Halobacillus sp. BAB-2008]ELK47844.1 N-acetyltransferase GCN5 [Halobacillus sp. BAB-2008]
MFQSMQAVPLGDVTEAMNDGFSDYVVPMQMTEDQLANRIEKQGLSKEHSVVYIEEEEIAAVLLFGIDVFQETKQAWIGGMAVRPKFRGRGIARKLLDFAVKTAEEADCAEVLLEVIMENTRAWQIYEAYGFETINELMVAGLGALPSPDDGLPDIRFEKEEEDVTEPYRTPWQNRLERTGNAYHICLDGERVGWISFMQREAKAMVLQMQVTDQSLTARIPAILQQLKVDFGIEQLSVHNFMMDTKEYEGLADLVAGDVIQQYQMKKSIG